MSKVDKFEIALDRAKRGVCVICGKMLGDIFVTVNAINKRPKEAGTFEYKMHKRCFDEDNAAAAPPPPPPPPPAAPAPRATAKQIAQLKALRNEKCVLCNEEITGGVANTVNVKSIVSGGGLDVLENIAFFHKNCYLNQ